MAHRIIYIEHTEKLRLYLDNLKIESDQGELLIPISDISVLIIDNYKANLSVQLINKLVENNVSTILCGIDHLPYTQVLPLNGHFSQSGNIMKQIQWEESKKKLLQKLIVKAKITNQIETLRMNNKSKEVIERLLDFSKEVLLGDVGNREGLAAKMYFREIFGNEFIRFDNDVCNAALNYGYSILRSTISSIIIAKGYIGNIGLFHKGKSNMFNLSDDVIEVFRPIVDNYVLNYISDEILFKQEHREELIKLVNAKIKFNGKVHTITNVIGYYFDSIIKTLDSENENDFIYPEVKVYYDL